MVRPRSEWSPPTPVSTWVVLNLEAYRPGPAGGPSIQPHLRSEPEIANASWREYGNRVGFWRLLDLFDDLDIRPSVALSSRLAEEDDAMASAVVERGWEVIGHGIDNSTAHAGLGHLAESKLVRSVLDSLERSTGSRPRGWLTPGFAVSERTPTVLEEQGVAFVADGADDDEPTWRPVGAGQLLHVPYSLETNDITLCLTRSLTGPDYASTVIDHFAGLAAEADRGHLMALGLHTFLVGQPGRIRFLRQVLETLLASPDNRFVRGDQLLSEVPGGNASASAPTRSTENTSAAPPPSAIVPR